MVGFNMIKLCGFLITMIVITGCIPQSKTTECKENEAFNAAQRRCLPINPSETSFVKIKSPTPSSAITVVATSGSPLTFSVMVENPYQKSYRIQWLRSFNGVQTVIAAPGAPSANIGDHLYQMNRVPSTHLSGAIGNHVITAQILEAQNNNVLDSHSFSVTLTDNPTPYGQGFNQALSTPITTSPFGSVINFNFDVMRNGRQMSTPALNWKLTKLTGTPLPTRSEVDNLTNSNLAQHVGFVFNPANPMNDGIAPAIPYSAIVGSYRLEASIVDGLTTFSSYFWDITIKHTDLGAITAAAIPIPGNSSSAIRAFNGIPYSNTTTSNFSYNNSTTRGQFCVTVSDGDGRYGGGVIVRYYLGNEPGHVYQGETDALDNTICLEDASALDKNLIVFQNSNPNLEWSTSIKARVFDKDTLEEYTNYVGGTYPLMWSVQVEPQNKAPKLTFADVAGSVSCASTNATGTIRSGCHVIQDNPDPAVDKSFVIAFNVTDEHFDAATIGANIAFTARLTRDATTIDATSCVKNFSDPGTIVAGAYTCRFSVPAFDDAGSINPLLSTWRISLDAYDNGSPYNPADQKHANLVWELNVQELNTAPTATLAVSLTPPPYTSIVSATEKDTILFTVNYSDDERDPYRLELYRCEDAVTCSETLSPLITSAVTTYPLDWAVNRKVAFTIPDGFVPDLATATSVRFRMRVTDIASTATAIDNAGNPAINHVVDTFVTININNYNPAPVFAQPNKININPPGVDPLNPLGIDYTAFASFPLTLDPGVITDASNPGNTAEGNIAHQWSISSDNEATWTPIAGATQKLLRWTPGAGIVSGNYHIRLCVTDNSPKNPIPVCNNSALIKVESNMAMGELIDTSLGLNEIAGSPAVWVDTSATGSIATHPHSKVIYAAYPVKSLLGGIPFDNIKIHVAKFLYNSDNNGRLEKLNEFSFDALDIYDLGDQQNTHEVKDLQLVGDDNSLYIAYLAHIYPNGVTLAGYRPEVRRIMKDFGVAYNKGERTDTVHPGPLGFGYNGFWIRHTQVAPCACWAPAGLDPEAAPANVQDGLATLTTTALEAGATLEFTLDDPSPAATWTTITVIAGNETQKANDIAAQINAHVAVQMKGFVARVTGGASNQVEIHGPMYNDYTRVPQAASKLGKIFINAGTFYMPFINESLTAPNTHSISVAHFATTTARLETATVSLDSIIAVDTKADDLDNVIDVDGNLVIAYISDTNPGQGKLLKLNGVNFVAPPAPINVLNGKTLTQIKLSSNAAAAVNGNYFVMGRAVDSTYWISRIPTNLSNPNQTWELDAATSTGEPTLVVHDFQIRTALGDSFSTSLDEARILLATDKGIYAFKALANQTVTCGSCSPINKDGELPPADAQAIDLSAIIPLQKLGSAGNIYPTESTRNMMVYVHIGQDTVANDPIQRLWLGIINADRSISDSSAPNSAGLFGPVIFKN